MKELVAPASVEKGFLFLATAGPMVGVILGSILGAHQKRTWPTVVGGALLGGIGTLIYVMWRVYNVITNAFGLDSLANLALQLVMFAILGMCLGFACLRITNLLKRLGAKR